MWQHTERTASGFWGINIFQSTQFRLWMRGIDAVALSYDANVHFMLRGYCYASSSKQDVSALGGFGTSDNRPVKVENIADELAGTVYLKASPEEFTLFAGGHKGMVLHLVNATERDVSFGACDSRINIVQEARDAAGNWRAIEYLPSSWCGNSYHRVILSPGEEWRFKAPKYIGVMKTRLRFKLTDVDARVLWPVYSNEFEGSVNPEQFSVRQTYRPRSVMDPYLN